MSNNVLPDPLPVTFDTEKDIFGHQVVVQPYNQIELRLDDTDYADYIDEAKAGGGSGGAVTQSGGLLNVASGTAATGSAIVTSKDQVRYRPGIGIYCAGTAVFTTAAANSIQRVGMADTTAYANSLTFGYNDAGVFGIRYTRGGAEISFTAQADWDDPCMGGVSSEFTRDGTPEILDPTTGNLYRFEAGLFGFAGWVAKVWSPDNGWITVLTYRHINTSASPVFTLNTFKVILAATKASGAGSLVIKSQCWGAGTGNSSIRLGSTMMSDRTLATPVRAVIAGRSTAGGTTYVNVKVNPSGTLAIGNESVGATGAAVPASATLIAGTDGTNLRGLSTDESGQLQGIDSGEREYTHVTATVTASGDTTIHTPAAGKAIRLRWIYALNDPAATAPARIAVKLGATTIYNTYGISKRQMVTGAADAVLAINLSAAGTVAVTAILEEVTL